jgi:glutamate--cysteine ligase
MKCALESDSTESIHGAWPSWAHQLLDRKDRVESWLDAQLAQGNPLPYASVDIRNAGFKLAAVDTNCFPAGFNNLHPATYPQASAAMRRYLSAHLAEGEVIALLAESHSRNMFYYESLAVLRDLIVTAGFTVRLATLMETGPEETLVMDLAHGRTLTLERLHQQGETLYVGQQPVSLLWLNNDLSAGLPEIIREASIPVVPPPGMGWQQRSKWRHFSLYSQVVHHFATTFDLDPWQWEAACSHCQDVDLRHGLGLTCLKDRAQEILEETTRQYAMRNLSTTPFVVAKADQGTYGLAVMVIRSPEELDHLNRRQRQRMARGKEGVAVSRVFLQEGVPTTDARITDQAPAEPVVYLIGGEVVGLFYRVHPGRGDSDSLNAPGMEFVPVEHMDDRGWIYGVVARLAHLAAMQEAT